MIVVPLRKIYTMAQIKSEAAYRAILKRIDALLPLTGDDVPRDNPNVMELDALTDLIVEYEAIQLWIAFNFELCYTDKQPSRTQEHRDVCCE